MPMSGAGAAREPEPGSEPPPAAARIVHRTRERWRLRVPARRHDLGYAIALYDALRAEPEIREVTVNPVTAGVLVWFDPADTAALPEALQRSGLLRLAPDVDAGSPGLGAGRQPGQPPAPGTGGSAATGAHHAYHMSVNDIRILVFLIMLALSVYQLTRKQFVAPALTMALYVIDLITGLKMEHDAAEGRLQRPTAGEAAGPGTQPPS
jgi:hypothetical protein